jgi:hypothetical protein
LLYVGILIVDANELKTKPETPVAITMIMTDANTIMFC